MVARVSLSPDPLDARFSYGWRLPGFYNADVQLMLPSLPERLPNATLFPGLTRAWKALEGFKMFQVLKKFVAVKAREFVAHA